MTIPICPAPTKAIYIIDNLTSNTTEPGWAGKTHETDGVHSHLQPVQCTNKLLSDFSSKDIESVSTKASGDVAILDSLTATANSNSHGKSESTDGSQEADNTTGELLAMT